MPIAINPSRPSSTSTVPSGAGGNGGPPRTTATSRRGGRTRSRSPPVVNSRQPGNGEPSSGLTGGENPSSAAAAAAAAAKAISSGAGSRGGPASWREQGQPEDSSYYAYDKQGYSMGSRNWPRGDPAYSNSAHRNRYAGGYDEAYYRHMEEERRYRGSQRASRGHSGAGGRAYTQDYGYAPEREAAPIGRTSATGSGGTSLVIGGATPIHVPKMPGPVEKPPRVGSASSVFRGRPASKTGEPVDDLSSEDSPHKLLLSLRTPSTTSFEEKGADKEKKSVDSLSPDGPPKIQNSHQGSPVDALFEPQRTSDVLKNPSALEMTASFTLFNQSFDSFGDSHYFPVEASLQNDSFGITGTASVENDANTQMLQKNLSMGANGNQQVLNPSSSGALTIGYSPVHSFGNASNPSRRGSNMMLVGGNDARSASPTQALGVYRSYSGGGHNAPRYGPLEDSHLRMSVGSFGLQSASFSRPYGESMASPVYYPGPGPVRSQENGGERGPSFYELLAKYKAAFQSCTFLLPGLKAAILETPTPMSVGSHGSFGVIDSQSKSSKWNSTSKPLHRYGGQFRDPSPQDISVARRRVESSVCAFGGNLNHNESTKQDPVKSDRSAIFREKGAAAKKDQTSASVTPSSTTSANSRLRSRQRQKYEEELPGRYYENESRLSWEFEENPPVELPPPSDDSDKPHHGDSDSKDDHDRKEGEEKSESDMYFGKRSSDSPDPSGKRPSSASPQPKMRYRCKLCGKPKQNHTCPFQQSLARSIGVMVFPAVNAFTACEPGKVANALSDMNNFIDVQRELGSSTDSSPHRPSPERTRMSVPPRPKSTQVTPDNLRSSQRPVNSPSSFVVSTTVGKTPKRRGGNMKKRRHSQIEGEAGDQNELLFVEAMELRPEQFRIVSQTKAVESSGAFSYPALPLPYAQRKRLSDNLFALSNEIPKLTDECARVLREAREKDMWDLAVAELMTQVVVIIHCPEGDTRFEGLRQYLLTLGIAC